MIVVAYAVGAAIAVAAVIVDRGSLGTVFPLVVTAASAAIVGVLLLLWRRAGLERAIAQVRGAESVVATGLVEAPPADVAELIAALRRLGFDLVGVTDTTVGGPPIRTWVLAEREGTGTTWVEVGIAGQPIAIFLSQAGDGRFLETSFPGGETIDHPNLFAMPIGESLEEALSGHRATLADWSSRAGPALVVRTLDDYRRAETELRERTAGMRISAYLERVVKPGLRNWVICALIATVAFFVVVLLPGP